MTMQAEILMKPICAGTFCWNELATHDTEVASAFYCSMFGWSAEVSDFEGKPYTVFKKDDCSIAGMTKLDDNSPEDAPSHWGFYVSVDDVDATAARVEALGGKICSAPQEAGDEGRFAVLADPTGAFLSIFKGGDGMNPCGIGTFCWNELSTTDTDVANTFYTNLFGWTSETSDMGDELYTEFKNSESSAGGMMNMHWEGQPSWLGYIHVANVDATVAKAKELGATICVEPSDIPSIGRFSVFTDPTGATIGVFTCLSEEGCDCSCS